jgi:hypothetical protein
MAELHKFKDDCQTPENRPKPIKAQELDDNFKTVRVQLSASLSSWLKIVQTPGSPDQLDFVTPPPSAESIPTFSGGVFSGWTQTEEC